MKKVYYSRDTGGDEILEVIIRDSTGAKIEVRRCNLSDSKECGKIYKWLIDKYGFAPTIPQDFLSVENDFFKLD